MKGGGSTSFSKIDTSARSMFGTQTLMSMRQFIEETEKECSTHDDAHDTELEVKDTKDTPEAEQKKTIQQEGIKALNAL